MFLQSAGVVFFSTVTFYTVAVLFGAHATNQVWGTLFWSCTMSLLCVLPAIMVLNDDSQHWIRVLLQHRLCINSERHIYYGSLGAVFGAWFGAFPILLDWNRPWQVWPIPSCMGAVMGGAIAHVLCATLNYMNRRSIKTLIQT